MELYYAFSVIIVLAALFSYVNVRYIKLPMTIGIMVVAMMVSVGIRLFGEVILQVSLISWSLSCRGSTLQKS